MDGFIDVITSMLFFSGQLSNYNTTGTKLRPILTINRSYYIIYMQKIKYKANTQKIVRR
jgi:hypothetical protein